MKKLVSLAIILSMLIAGMPAMSAGTVITIEGESFRSATFAPGTDSSNDFSGGKMLRYLDTPDLNNAYKLVYNIEVPKDGTYSLSVRCSQIDTGWTSDFLFSVNEGELIPVTTVAQKTADYKNSVYPSLIKEYDVGAYDLYKGDNTVSIVIDKNDVGVTGNVGKLVLMLDSMTFTELDFGFNEFIPSKDCGVFEKGTRIQYNLSFFARASENYTYDYKIKDFWGRTAAEGSLELMEGKKNMLANFGLFELGWYKVELFNHGETAPIAYAHFSVVPKASERYNGETPFAMDFASSQLVKKQEQTDKLITAAKLAGIQFTRERGGWTTFKNSNRTLWDTMVIRNNKKIKEAGLGTSQILINQQLRQSGASAFTDLFDAYNFQFELAKNTDKYIDLIEIDNELDGATSTIPADIYAACLKAMFIANADCATDMKMSMVSLCLDIDNTFNDGLIRNEVAKFTDLYNFHAHTTYAEKNKILGIRENYITDHNEAKYRVTDKDIPVWITEAGIYLDLGNEAELTEEQAQIQARYLTTATVEALSQGVDKFFWFVWPKFVEHNKELGTFDANLNPNPAYQAEAICSYLLGKAEYKGGFEENYVKGHVFDNGKNSDVMVLWTDVPQKYSIVSDTPVKVVDIMGEGKLISPVDGKVGIDVAYYPVYVCFEGKADVENYYPRTYSKDETLKRDFNSGERIILQQSFDQNLADARNKGYELANGKTEKMVLTVNNFNKEAKSVKITGKLDGYEVNMERDTVTVPAMGKVSLNAELIPNGITEFKGIDDIKKYLKFTAETDGNISSPSVSTVRIVNDKIITPVSLMDGMENIKNFDINNVLAGADTDCEVMEDGSYRFDAVFNATSAWYYPKLKVKDVSKLTENDGIVFWIKGDKSCEGLGDFKSFVNYSDGRRYFTGNAAKYQCVDEWVQVKIKWDDFLLFTSPYGDVDLRPFDPALIESIEIGGNFYPKEKDKKIMFYVKEAGFFVNEDDSDAGENIIKINGINENEKYNASELGAIRVELPENCSNIKVMLTEEYIESFTRDGNMLSIDLSARTKGKYTLRVIGKDDFGFSYSEKVDFYIN